MITWYRWIRVESDFAAELLPVDILKRGFEVKFPGSSWKEDSVAGDVTVSDVLTKGAGDLMLSGVLT